MLIDVKQLQSIRDVLGDDTHCLLRGFEDNARAQLARIRGLMADRDGRAAAELLHRIKGSGSYLGTVQLVELCSGLSVRLRADPDAAVAAELAEIEHCLQATLRALHQLLGTA